MNLEIKQAILKLTPSLDQAYAEKLAYYVENASKQHGVEWWVIIAIVKQESNFNYKAVNWESHDYGISQFNHKTIRHLKLDLGRLLTDKRYAIEETARYLSDLKQKYAMIDARNGRVWYTRFHSFTPSLRTVYKEKLHTHLKVIKRLPDVRRKHTALASRAGEGR